MSYLMPRLSSYKISNDINKPIAGELWDLIHFPTVLARMQFRTRLLPGCSTVN